MFYDGIRSPASNRGLGKGAWNMIQECELAKSIRQCSGLKNIAKIYQELTSSGASSPTVVAAVDQVLVQQAKATVDDITEKVQTATDMVLLEELLCFCDKLD